MDYEKLGKSIASMIGNSSIYACNIQVVDPYDFVNQEDLNKKEKLFYRLRYCYGIKNKYLLMDILDIKKTVFYDIKSKVIGHVSKYVRRRGIVNYHSGKKHCG